VSGRNVTIPSSRGLEGDTLTPYVNRRAHDADYLNGSLEDYVADSVKKGWVSIWWAYREAHETNLKRVSKVLQDHALPKLPD
jgi:hypothetical protein